MEKPEKCPKCGGDLIGIEYWYTSPNRYDGVSEWACENVDKCKYRIGRWSGIELKDGEEEGRYGEGSPIKNLSLHSKRNEHE